MFDGPQLGRRRIADDVEDVGALEVALRGDPEVLGDLAGALSEHLVNLVESPHIELAFDSLRVGIFGAVEPAFGVTEVSQHVVQRGSGDVGEVGSAARDTGPEVEAGQLSVVIKHLFEVRREPMPIDGIPGEPTADLVVDPACGHFFKGLVQHLISTWGPLLILDSEEKLEDWLLGELRCATETAVIYIEGGGDLLVGEAKPFLPG